MATATAPARLPDDPWGGGAALPAGGLRHDAQAVRVVWHREIIAFFRNRIRIGVALVQPVLFLFVLGTGLSGLTQAAAGDISFRTFMFPGVLALAVLMPAFFSAGSVVFDREFGFLREMLVAPIRRGSIVVGKCLGGATVAAIQGALILCLAGLVDVPYDPLLLLTLIGELILLSFLLVAFGVMCAARITQFQSFMAVVQMIMFPLLFLSGAMFPLTGLPTWLHTLTRLDPLTYAVDPLRRAVFDHLDVSERTRQTLDPGVTWGGWQVPTGLELGIVAVAGIAMLVAAIIQFQKVD
ncbi:MAG: ABC transporter permease [Thermoleophilia bacterium]